jgi:hypothetical protein
MEVSGIEIRGGHDLPLPRIAARGKGLADFEMKEFIK